MSVGPQGRSSCAGQLSMQAAGSGRIATSEDNSPPTKKQRTTRAAAKDSKAPKDRSSQYRGVTKHRRSGRCAFHEK